MLYSVLVFSVCLHITRACLPMQPAEDMPCPPPPLAKGGAPPFVTSGLGQPMSQNGDIVYKCTPPEKLIVVESGMPPTVLADDETLTCKPNSAIFVTKDGKAVGTKTYTCGGDACAVCPLTQLFDKDAPACEANPDVLCKSKPMWMIDPVDKCQKLLACTGDGEMLYLITSTTSEMVDLTKLKCNKQWQADGATPIPAEAGFACVKLADCGSCAGEVDMVYDKSQLLDKDKKKPYCVFTCPTDFDLTYNNTVYSSVICDMDNEMVTLDTPFGTELTSPDDEFTCAQCGCTAAGLNAGGDIERCPRGTVCSMPNFDSACKATCAAPSIPVYVNAAKTPIFPPAINCVNNVWIGPEVDVAVGITCQTDADDLSSMPPTGGAQCPALGVYTCAQGVVCDASLLVYVKDTNGYTVMCKEGSLITENGITEPTIKCEDTGMWTGNPPPTMASCVTDDSPIRKCVDAIPFGYLSIDYSCELGTCYLFCIESDRHLEYDGISMSQYLKCQYGEEIITVDDQTTPDPATISCVL